MAYIAVKPESYAGQVVGDGQCVAFVRKVTGAPPTSEWSEGATVKGSGAATNTAIATFQGGKYTNSTNGNSHAAILVAEQAAGLDVWDQWLGQPVHRRTIRFRGGATTPNNDGDAFSVIE